MIASYIIRDYLTEKFKDISKISSSLTELLIPSVFSEADYKRHMSINLDTGLWQCFKTGNKGNIIQLYAFLEGVSYNNAEADLLFKELFAEKSDIVNVVIPELQKSTLLQLSPISPESYTSSDPIELRAWSFLYERKLFNLYGDSKPFYVCHDKFSKFRDRLIIPFEEDKEMYYFQARALTDTNPKYLNPSFGWPKGSHILYPYYETRKTLFICEGPLDAISLQNSGINATCTLGSSVSSEQLDILKEFPGKLVIAYDNDEAGNKGINRFDYLRRIKRMADLSICHPPSEVKDWNEALIKGYDLKLFVAENTKEYNYDYLVDHLLTTL